jgi:class 3 adenylate cyclase
VLLDRVGGVDGDLVLRLLAPLDPEVEVEELDVEIGKDQLLLDEGPDDPGHLVAVELDDGVFHLDFRHPGGRCYVIRLTAAPLSWSHEQLGRRAKDRDDAVADLVGSTELASELDPEDLRGRLEPFFDAARSALEQHGGTVEKYIGDAVMAVFGAPVAHGDDPDRAIAAALTVLEKVSAIDGNLSVRVGIETGEVLAVPGSGDLRVTGEAVNAAARLQQAASPGEVLVGERTARACRRAQLERDGHVDAKGMEPLPAFRSVAVCEEDELSEVPLVGREDDLDMLRLIARRAARERVPQLVTVIGEAGIGKTRLAAEVFAELRDEGWRTVVGRSPPYGHGIAFWALGEILHDAAGMSADARADQVEPALQGVLTEVGAEDAPNWRRTGCGSARGRGGNRRRGRAEARLAEVRRAAGRRPAPRD